MLLKKTSNEWPGSKYRAKTKKMCSTGLLKNVKSISENPERVSRK
jgi:hypothetical protein